MNFKSLFTDKKMYQYHSWLGLIGGIFILLISLSGTILTFGDEIDAMLNSEVIRVSEQGNPKNLDEITASIKQQYPTGKLLNLRIYTGETDKSVRAEVASENRQVLWVYVNPYTAQVIGNKEKESAFIRVVFEFHEHLLLGFTGDIVLLLIGICLLGSVITGFIYYRKSLFQVFKIGVRFGKNPQIVNADLHKLLGVSALLFMFVMSGTGIFFHFERIERALGRMLGEERREEPKQETPDALPLFSAHQFLQLAQEKINGFSVGFVRFPQKSGEKLSFRGNRPESIAILGKFNTTIDFDVNTKEVSIFHAEEADEEYKMEHIFEELHFGRYGGKFTKTIYFMGGLATFVMVITGFIIWLRNKK
jgi:uncharacterized iron-regulated membrane protein